MAGELRNIAQGGIADFVRRDTNVFRTSFSKGKPSDDTGDIDIAWRPQQQQQLPSPPISPPPMARFAPDLFRAMQDDAVLALPAFGAEGGDNERDLEEGGGDPFADPVLVEVEAHAGVEEENDADADAETPLTARPRRQGENPFGDPGLYGLDTATGVHQSGAGSRTRMCSIDLQEQETGAALGKLGGGRALLVVISHYARTCASQRLYAP
ncbi:hypothetical protein K438DRAFT_1758231 [Mycena galopus ATCC 62051]|nr:hypothetical protein K438DRAFT_1758231 [Mycena galopus ATCC 62051]